MYEILEREKILSREKILMMIVLPLTYPNPLWRILLSKIIAVAAKSYLYTVAFLVLKLCHVTIAFSWWLSPGIVPVYPPECPARWRMDGLMRTKLLV